MPKFIVTSYVTVCVKSHTINAINAEEAKKQFLSSLHLGKGPKSALCDSLNLIQPSPVISTTQYGNEVTGHRVSELDEKGNPFAETYFDEAPDKDLAHKLSQSIKTYGPVIATVQGGMIQNFETLNPALKTLEIIVVDEDTTCEEEQETVFYTDGTSADYATSLHTPTCLTNYDIPKTYSEHVSS